MKSIFVLAGVACAAASMAVTDVVPNAFAATEAPSAFSLTVNTTPGRTYQWVIGASQLTSFVGTNLTGMQMRLNAASAAWPANTATMSFFDVYIGAAVAPNAISATFANNVTGPQTQVRSGALVINPGDYTNGGSPNNFGPSIGFNLASYTYNGGDLAITARFSGVSASPTVPQGSFDAIAATDAANGYGSLFAAKWTSTSTGTTGVNANFVVMKLTGEPVPEPATMAALGLGAAAVIRRHRRAPKKK